MDIVRSLLRAITPSPDGDTADRINYCFSAVVLVVLSAFISGWRLDFLLAVKTRKFD